MPVVEHSGIRLEYPAGDEQSIGMDGAIKLRARVIPPHVNNRVWFAYRIDEGQWIRRQATREFASTDEEQYSLAVDLSTGRAGLRYLAFVRRGGITVPRGADTTSPDGDRSLKELTVYVSLIHDNAASRQPRPSEERSHDSGVGLPSDATHAKPRTERSAVQPGSIAVGLAAKPALTGSQPVADISQPTAAEAGTETGEYRVEGHILLEHGLPASRITLRLYNIGFGGAETELREIKTDAQGGYAFSYAPGGVVVNLQVRAVDAQGREVSLSRTKFNADKHEVLNLVAPARLQPLAPEYQRLSADLVRHLGELKKLADARESAERRDLTVLNRATGWDARLIALASKAASLSNDPDVNLPQEALYGLFRAGLPSDKLQLAQVSAEVVEQTLTKVREVGIVGLNGQQIADLKAKFEIFAHKTRLAAPLPGSRSTSADFINASGLDEGTKKTFTSVYLNHPGDADQLWENARDAGLNDGQIHTLQLQGKLAFLTGSSVEMTTRLQAMINDPEQLVEQDYYRAEKWKAEIIAQGRNDEQKLQELIPPVYAGERVEERLDAYAEDMARKVRLSYPTQVVSRMVEQDTADDFRLGTTRSATATLLKNAAARSFRLGQTPVQRYFNEHKDFLERLAGDEQIKKTALDNLKTLQRVYQITPSNEAMLTLMQLGFTSAYDVVALSQDEFLDRYGDKFRTLKEAELVYRKSQQVSSVTYNLFTIAKKQDSEPPVAGLSAPVEIRESVRNELIKQFPTMESLFGSMDFCECEHCRSVLSPAAYVVALLQFIDPEPGVWDNFLDTWKKNHGGHAYSGPYTLNGQQFVGKYKKPYDALIERRPDLPHIPLTCENTNTALPYIDIVNEILEYYVAHGKLEEKAAHDTGEVTTAELLAEPQNVIRQAYDKLREARYPLNLPFDLWIETVRQFCNYFGTPLERVLEVFRRSDELFAPAQAFDRSTIFIESLGLSPAEAAIFTDFDPLGNDKWHELYGLPTVRPAIQNPTNVEHAKLAVDNDDAKEFREGLACTFFDVSANALSAESKIISAIGPSDSGGAGQTIITFVSEWTAPPDAGDLLVCDAPATLKSAKTLSRRLGVTYKEIAEIVQTGFVNPKLKELGVLFKLGVSIQQARFYQDKEGTYSQEYEQFRDLLEKDEDEWTETDRQRFRNVSEEDWKILVELHTFKQRLKDLAEEFSTSGMDAAKLDMEIKGIDFHNALILKDPDTGCNFDLTTLQYADGTKADPIAFLRITLFVRLWRKLGWSIEETDRALSAFIPQSAPFDENPANLAKQPLKTALIYLSHLKALDEGVKVGKQSRLKLLTLWSDIATSGKNPLYAQLFLTRSVLKSGEVEVVANGQPRRLSVFDDSLGRYLLPAELTKIAEQVRHEVRLQDVKDADKIDEAAFAGEPRISLRYDALGEVQYLAYFGVLSDSEKTRLAALSPSDALTKLLDAVQVKAKEFTLIKGHVLALQGALGLTADEVGRILADAGKSLDTTTLSLPNVSLLYRYGLLAKALQLVVRELIALKQLSGLDPFKLLHPDPLATIEEDHPFSQTLRFVQIVEEVKDSGLKIEDLDYLLRHRFDEAGKYRPNREGTLALLKTLAEGVLAIRAEHGVPDDPGALSEDVLRQKLGLALPPDVVERFLAMMNGTAEFTATKAGVEPTDELKPATFADEDRIRELYYKEVPHKEQKLTFRGVLFDPQKTELQTRFDAVLTAPQKIAFAELLHRVQKLAREFFDNQLKKQKLRLDGEAGFLEDGDFNTLFLGLKPLEKILPTDMPQEVNDKLQENEEIEQENQTTLQQRRYRIAKAFLPFLQQRLIRQFIVQTMTAHTGADPVLVESLTTDERLLAVAGSKPLLASFEPTGERGVSAAFFDSDDLSGAAQAAKAVVRSADTSLKDTHDAAGNPLNPANSARFEGYLEVPTPGAYRFYIELDKQNAEAELRFDHLPDPVFLQDAAAADNATLGEQQDEFLELKPGIPYRFSLDLTNLGGGGARLLVQGETLPKDGIAQLPRYPLHAMAGAERAILLLTKALQLIQTLGLSEREIRYLLTHANKFDDLNLKTLPARDAQHALDTIAASKMEVDNTLSKEQALLQARNENPDLASEADLVAQHFKQFLRLAAYARLKRDLAPGTDDLIDIFEANELTDTDTLDNNVYPFIAKLTRRDETVVKATANALVTAPQAPAFKSEEPLLRLWETLQVVERFGVPVASLLAWTRIVSPTAMPEQRFEIARDLKEAIKARFEPETWQRVAQPIFDKLRQRQRDALVSHVMHQRGFDRMEQLYEYFLIDPGMEPVVQTSRIRLAISSVQLFIQRCLLNLELKVHPSTINSKHWEWMKRYRVWEANFKIFLFPENWLEPEFRDDKTHLFAELEGALLQGDVSSDLVEDAFLNYLKKLDELARLDIVAMHIENDPDPARRTLHVFGRTYSQPHKYFYRRYAHQMWTSWEPVTAEIEGDHLAPVVWRDRLYLFWVTFMEKAEQPGASPPSNELKLTEMSLSELTSGVMAGADKRTIEAHLHWSEYLQGEWSTRESGGFNAPSPVVVPGESSFSSRKVFIHVSTLESGEDLGVYIHLGGIDQAFYLAGRNSTPEQAGYGPKPENPYRSSARDEHATRYSGSGPLKVTFNWRIITEDGKPPEPIPIEKEPYILEEGGTYTLLPCNNDITLGDPEIASRIKPLFYQDNAHTFFIEPSLEERTIEDSKDYPTSGMQPKSEKMPDMLDMPEELVQPFIPREPFLIDPGRPPEAIFEINPRSDWLVNPVTVLQYGGGLIGPNGLTEVNVLPLTEVGEAIASGGIPVNVGAGSDLAPGNTVVATHSDALESAGLIQTPGGLNVVGSSGLNSALTQNVDARNRSGFGAGNGGGRLNGR